MNGAATSNEFQERRIVIDGWPVKLTSYRVAEKFVCQADNVSPGAVLARFSADTPQEAESQAVSKARHLLGRTQRREV
ncbi:MAG: hypothetical protein JO097_06475 [Acidobacteriaceae bacterium]|nr:hypothetical protein [Acidobacteriaceae bacterium]MBV9766789.1 hypothetical protein [Acidobacteriaceae bacterium]